MGKKPIIVKLADIEPKTKIKDKFLYNNGCPCGWEYCWGIYNEQRHAHYHLMWSYGVPLPESLNCIPYIEPALRRPDFGYMLWRVRPEDPNIGHKFAYKMARLMQRENGYDLPGWHDNKKHFGKWILKQPIFYALVTRDRAVGFTVVEETDHYATWDGTPDGRSEFQKGRKKLKICLVWVASLWRRMGVATTLVNEVAREHKIPIEDIVWGIPLTEAGKALAFSLTSRGWIYIG